MNTMVRRTLIAACVLFARSGLSGCFAQQPLVGGYSTSAVTSREVIDAAVFAVKIQEKVMQLQAHFNIGFYTGLTAARMKSLIAVLNYS